MSTHESLTAKLYRLRGEAENDGNVSTVAAEAKALAEEAFVEGFLELAIDSLQFLDTDIAKLDLIGKWVERLNEQGDLAKASFLLTALPKVGNVAEMEMSLIEKMIAESKDLKSEAKISALRHAFELTKHVQARQSDAFALFRLAESNPASRDLARQNSAIRYAARILTSVNRTYDLRRQLQQELSLELALAGHLATATSIANDNSSSEFSAIAVSTLKLCICRCLNRVAPHRLLKSWFAPNIQYRSNETGITQWTSADVINWAKAKDSTAIEIAQVWVQVNRNIEKGDLETASFLIPVLKPYRLRVQLLLQIASLFRLINDPGQAQKALRNAAELAAECDSYQYRETELLEIATLQKHVVGSEVATATIRKAGAAVPILADNTDQAKALLRIAHTQFAVENYSDATNSVTQAVTLLIGIPSNYEIAQLIKLATLMQVQLGLFAEAQKSLMHESWGYRDATWLRQIVEIGSAENLETVHKILARRAVSGLTHWIVVWYEIRRGSVDNAVRLVSEIANTFSQRIPKEEVSLWENMLYWIALDFIRIREFDAALTVIRAIRIEVLEPQVFRSNYPRLSLLERLFQEAQKTDDKADWASKIITTLMFDQDCRVAELCSQLQLLLKNDGIRLLLRQPEYWLLDEGGKETLVSTYRIEGIESHLDNSFLFLSRLLSFQRDFDQANEVAALIKWSPKRDLAYKSIVAEQISHRELNGAEQRARMISGLHFRDEALTTIAHAYAQVSDLDSALKTIESIEDLGKQVRVILQICRETPRFASCRGEFLTRLNKEERKSVTTFLKINESDCNVLDLAFALMSKTSDIKTRVALFFEIAEQLLQFGDNSKADSIYALARELILTCSSETTDEISNQLRKTSNRLISNGDFQEALNFAARVNDTVTKNSMLCDISIGFSSMGKFSDALDAASQITDTQGTVAVSRIVRDVEEAFSKSRLDEASSWLDLIEQAIRLSNAKQWLNGYDLMPMLSLKARLAAATKNIETSAKTFIELANQEDVFLESFFSISSDESRLPFFEACLSHMHCFVSLAVQFSESSATTDNQLLLDAYALMLKRKGLLTQRRRQEVLVRLDEANAHLFSIVQSLSTLREQRADVYLKQLFISSEARLSHRSSKSAGSNASLQEIEKDINRLEIELSHLTSTRVKGDAVDAIDPYKVSQAMTPGSVLVDFIQVPSSTFITNDDGSEETFSKYFAIVLPAKQPHKLKAIDLGKTDQINWLIREYREEVSKELRGQLMGHPVNTQFQSDLIAVSIRDKVIQPLMPWIDEFETWFISPDGLLNTVVFDAFPCDPTGERDSRHQNGNAKNISPQANNRLYFADTKEISYVTSGRDIVNWSRKSADNDKIVVIANPDFDWRAESNKSDSEQADRGAALNNSHAESIRTVLHRQLDRGIRFEKLEAAQAEAEEIAKWFKTKIEMLVGRNATKTNVKKIHSPKILHFATHGFYLDPAAHRPAGNHAVFQLENPLMHCGLALTGVNTWLGGGVASGEIGNGILTGEEISSLNLVGTKLVVLSACETGLGRLRFGEGVYGLRRALILAGAESAVVSLWRVSDDATANLMQNYYKDLSQGAGRSEALKNAKSALRRQDSGRWNHAGFWAGFILEGNPYPI